MKLETIITKCAPKAGLQIGSSMRHVMPSVLHSCRPLPIRASVAVFRPGAAALMPADIGREIAKFAPAPPAEIGFDVPSMRS